MSFVNLFRGVLTEIDTLVSASIAHDRASADHKRIAGEAKKKSKDAIDQFIDKITAPPSDRIVKRSD